MIPFLPGTQRTYGPEQIYNPELKTSLSSGWSIGGGMSMAGDNLAASFGFNDSVSSTSLCLAFESGKTYRVRSYCFKSPSGPPLELYIGGTGDGNLVARITGDSLEEYWPLDIKYVYTCSEATTFSVKRVGAGTGGGPYPIYLLKRSFK